ncbi:SWIM zinc finger family protein [Cohnella fermenti]|uniref:SWIM-type domain-containing protein n=1 Tax=Cohnella fermenti TaxID=2565925 RepID=A0A4S4BMU6_9BACL|nr:SWIM zinc finger family protein [Cohnella fermenti]THF73781.1 hypothetical protein E6C55_27710 [Cohnella fermenti]
MAFYNDYPKYVPVAEKRRKAEKAVEKLRKGNSDIAPVRITGRTVARTWWGKSWCDNLERYADYANRIDRGRSYVRHGAVLDLRLAAGRIAALVQGSASKPYKVEVAIDPLAPGIWQEMVQACAGKIDSLQELAAGKLPAALSELFTMKGKGLFPSPKEIRFSCSCPDGASMCKHVAAVLYGIGARLDDDSALFFTMRNVKMADLVASTIAEKSKDMMTKADGAASGSGRRSRRVLADADLSGKFGIAIDSGDGDGRGRGAANGDGGVT